jgi:TIR domain
LSESASHIFICFSSKDEAVAREVVEFLEAKDIKCWISSRDVPPGQNYQENIVQAIERARGIVFLFSAHSNESGEIKKELSIGGSLNMPVFPVRLAPITPHGALRYELAIRQWIDIFPPRQDALDKLAETVKKAIDAPATEDNVPALTAPLLANAARRKASPPRQTMPSPAKKRPPTARAPIVAPGTQEFEAIRALLARHIGPIAKVFVEKAATGSRTPDEFCERLATHVAEPSDRTSFVRAVRTHLTLKP